MKLFVLLCLILFSSVGVAADYQLGKGSISSVRVNGKWIKQQEFKLSWTRVTTRANGEVLPYTELAKYTLYSTNDGPSDIDSSVKVIDKKLTSIKIKQPTCTTYWYALSATDTKNNQSALSQLISVTTYCP